MARPVQATEFANDYEYQQAKRQARKASQTKRQSTNGRKAFNLKGSDE